jgi:hypothetical protein
MPDNVLLSCGRVDFRVDAIGDRAPLKAFSVKNVNLNPQRPCNAFRHIGKADTTETVILKMPHSRNLSAFATLRWRTAKATLLLL